MSLKDITEAQVARRSREGAWIEMPVESMVTTLIVRRSREGAWIEILVT